MKRLSQKLLIRLMAQSFLCKYRVYVRAKENYMTALYEDQRFGEITDLRYSFGVMPSDARKARKKVRSLTNPHSIEISMSFDVSRRLIVFACSMRKEFKILRKL